MKKYGTSFVADLEGETLGGIYYLEDENIIRRWYAVSKRLEANKEMKKIIRDANRLIYCEAIKYAQARN